METRQNKPRVYFVRSSRREDAKIVKEKLRRLLEALECFRLLKDKLKPKDIIALKIHCGEEGNIGHILPEYLTLLIEDLKKLRFKPFLTDTNTLYHGQRMNAVDHLNLFRKHKFSKLNIPIIIADGLLGNDYVEVRIDGKHFSKVKIAKTIQEANAIFILTHLTGHMLFGFGGSLKNISMGCASKAGKMEQHCIISPKINQQKCKQCSICFKICPARAIIKKGDSYFIQEKLCIGCTQCINLCPYEAIQIIWSEDTKNIQERAAEYAYAILRNKFSIFINFLSFITKDCDCLQGKQIPLVEDIGILASFDPVAIDKASIDLVNKNKGEDFFKNIWPNIDYNILLKYAEQLKIGSMEYELVQISV